jgi:hypothetical protein
MLLYSLGALCLPLGGHVNILKNLEVLVKSTEGLGRFHVTSGPIHIFLILSNCHRNSMATNT